MRNELECLALLASLKAALAAAMRVIAAYHLDLLFMNEVYAIGIRDGVGVLADAAIRKAEGDLFAQ